MDGTFEERKEQLENECVVTSSQFAKCLDRLTTFMRPFQQLLGRQIQRDYAERFVTGLCSDLERKNAESIAYHFGLERKTIQHFIGESEWDDRPLRKELAAQIATQLGEANGVLILDPSSFVKSGRESVGVARQWCGRLGKVENCQVGLYLAYASSQGHALVDGELYLPKEWTTDKKRLKKAGVPPARRVYKTRHTIFLEILERHCKDLPHSWITGDDELGRPIAFRRKLQALKEQYLLAVPCNTKINVLDQESTTGESVRPPSVRSSVQIRVWAEAQPDSSWTRLDVRDTEKGPLLVELLKCQVETGRRSPAGIATEVAIVIRYRDRDRSIIKQDYYLSNAPLTTPAAEYARAAKAEHRIEECFQKGKGEAGMGDYEVRNWTGWHHHQTLSLVASWFFNVEARRAEKKDTGDDRQSNESADCLSDSHHVRMRFPPRRRRPSDQTAPTKPACQVVSLA